jgi:putative transcriptional regulator
MEFFNEHKLNHLQPQAGRLLIAEPFLGDTNFSRSVVLICESSETGSVGFILNHPTDLTIGDLLPELYTPSSIKIYQGGPVQVDTLHILHRLPDVLGGVEIYPGVYWGGSYEALQDLLHSTDLNPDDLRCFIGYSGWSPGQLEREMSEGSWMVSDADTHLLFDTSPKEVWKKSIEHLGKDFAYMKNLPINPQLN